jgi:glutamate/tyrosine decarboxylase-like PLP-dependent enzyme
MDATDGTPTAIEGADPLALDPETMRRVGYQTVDALIDGLVNLRDRPVLRTATPQEMTQRFGQPPESEPTDPEVLLQRLLDDILPFSARWDHPRMMGYIPGGGTWPAALADLIVSAWNVDTTSWRESAGPNQVELTVLEWFRAWIGYPPEAAGILLTGGSAANLTALACAREALVSGMDDRLVVYVSDQAHSSLARAARVLGFRPDQLRVLPSDPEFRMRPDALAGAIAADLRGGRRPFFVAAAAGSTNTGAVDPLVALAEISEQHAAWFHVDAAYGGFSILTERGRSLMQGISVADSVTLDPHKWLYQPYECGCVLVRDGDLLRKAFEIVPDYLRDAQHDHREVNFADRGLQLTRTSRAFKIWLSVNTFGLEAFRTAIDRSLDLARLAQQRIESSANLELITPATLGVVTFRRRFGGRDDPTIDAMNGELVRSLAESGVGFVTSTRLRGRYAIRIVPMNHATEPDDVLKVLTWFEEAEVPELPVDQPLRPREREAGVWLSWLAGAEIDARAIRAVPLFGSLTDRQAASLASVVRRMSVETGSNVVQQWEDSRDLYVILDGTASVSDGERMLGELGPGDVFGEVAAVEWGMEFGYVRTATVSAVSPLRVLVIPAEALRELLAEASEVADELGRLAQRRLSSG